MDSNRFNGNTAQLAGYETPFNDVAIEQEHDSHHHAQSEGLSEYFVIPEMESPFTKTFDDQEQGNDLSPISEEYVDLLGELNDRDFSDAISQMAGELEETWISKISNEAAMGSRYIPFASQQAEAYIEPLVQESEVIFDKLIEHFSGNDLADHSDTKVEDFFSSLEYGHGRFTPAQEYFLGGLIKKAKSVVKKGINLAKKGISTVGKIMPINLVLRKLKALVRPLLKKVLQFAIGKLPKNLQRHARSLAKKFLSMEVAGELETFETDYTAAGDIDAIQMEFDNEIANLLFTAHEIEMDNEIMQYESSFANIEREFDNEAGVSNIPSLEEARQRFITDLKELREGESPAPAIEHFLPAAIMALQPVIKVAIGIIGRQRVINFLAGLLAKLVAKYVPEAVAKPLAASIIDAGMGIIGFEVNEKDSPDVAYEAIANTIEGTIQNLTDLKEEDLQDNEALTLQLLSAFETAVADNFPSKYIKPQLRKTVQPGIWILKPRKGSRYMYKKFSHVYDIVIDPTTAASVSTFRGIPLASFLKDKLGMDLTKPVRAKVHLYEAINGTRLHRIAKHENLPGMNSPQISGSSLLHPLTPEASLMLLKEPHLGKPTDPRFKNRRYKIALGQRFYFLEIPGATLRMPPVENFEKEFESGRSGRGRKLSRSSDIQGVINFVRSEIQLNYFFSEEEAKSVVEKLNRNDYLGASMSIRYSVRKVLHGILVKNINTKVKIIHEAMPELYLEYYADEEEQFAPFAAIGRAVGGMAKSAGKKVLADIIEKIIRKVTEMAYKALVNYFKARTAEFKSAQASPKDGVTVQIIFINIPGMSSIRAVINAIKGKLSLGNIADLALPNIPTPEIKSLAGKRFS
ncbi:hypothetical protein [Salinimicrobium sp. TH3]|uniref:hypothetical protein n=1 Tax=Salinimicrobium sp. TH3 TaxID=2997342 RepID=UPI0022728E4C|nr:hypothetical protein [Salinimicrobium sp. TH3]MCY2687585.1 hypothetical protein [Salinimicrobium sp. TH3]